MSSEGALHIPGGSTRPALPVHPRFAEKLLEHPTVDIAAVVVTDVEYQALAVEDRVILFYKIIHVAGAHGAEVDIADIAIAIGFGLFASGQFPFAIAQIAVGGEVDG